MEIVKINFVDFWPGFCPKTFFLYRFLLKYFKVELSEKPDYLFCSSFGYNHWKYKNCIKIYYTGENLVPDFNIYDYGISFYYLSFGDRYLRFPLWLIYSWDALDKMEIEENVDWEKLLDRKFCNFVYSNGGWADPIREKFFKQLSKYKKVDSGGKYLNNIGYCVPDKLSFIKDYKFTIAIENSVVPGYTTEKIIEPMMMNSIPIYYGDPYIERDFNVKSYVNLQDYQSIDDAIEAIVELDKRDELYISKLQEKKFSRVNIKEFYEKELESFLFKIVGRDKSEVTRLSDYGFSRRYRKEMSRVTPWATSFVVEKGYGFLDRLKRLKDKNFGGFDRGNI